jgi:phospholipid transport system transporter-binding protein
MKPAFNDCTTGFPGMRSAMNAQSDLFRIREIDDGRHFVLEGELSFASASLALKSTAQVFSSRSEKVFDLAGIMRADSAGVALLLEWRRRAREAGLKLRYVNVPSQLQAIARVVRVEDILSADENGAAC